MCSYILFSGVRNLVKELDKLSDQQLRRWLKAGEPLAKADGGGLTFTLSRSGTAAWILRYRHGGKPKELTLGRYPDVSLKSARDLAREERSKIQRVIDVAAVRQREKRAASTSHTVRELANDYVDKVMPSLASSTAKQRRQHLKAHILPTLGNIPTRQITPDDIVAMLRKVGSKSTPNVAELVLTLASEIFKHGQSVSALTVNPCFSLSARAIVGRPNEPRKRLKLTEQELRILLPKLSSIGRLNELAVKILLATCVRIGELTRARWQDLDLERALWFVPDSSSKTGSGFTIPLPNYVVSLFKELKTFSGESQFVLPARQTRRSQTHGIEMPLEQRALNSMLHKLTGRLDGVRRFTPHDLRSTARSHLAALGANVIVAERCLNHSIGGLVGIYDQHDYLSERRTALKTWSEFLHDCEAGKKRKQATLVSMEAPNE